jgi:hypothetical protein
MISFLDTTTFWKPLIDGVNSFAQEIQNILILFSDFCKIRITSFFSLKLAMRSILPTDQKELVSLATFKEQKKTRFLEVFSKIQMIVFLKISYYFDFIWFL